MVRSDLKKFEKYIEEIKRKNLGPIDIEANIGGGFLGVFDLEINYIDNNKNCHKEKFPLITREKIGLRISNKYRQLTENNLEGSILFKHEDRFVKAFPKGELTSNYL